MRSKFYLGRFIASVTCGLWSPVHRPVFESQGQLFVRPPCRCGKTEPVYEYSDLLLPYFTQECIGYITRVPCPVHPCEHNHESELGSLVENRCLCSTQAQIDLCPDVKERQNDVLADRDNIWGPRRRRLFL
jgi:hypothetical protein